MLIMRSEEHTSELQSRGQLLHLLSFPTRRSSDLPGPEDSGVVETVFETKHQLTAEHLSKMFGFQYIKVESLEDLKNELTTFYDDSENPKIMEINTSNVDNAGIMRDYFRI